MVHNVQYTGVLLKDLAREVGVRSDAKWVLAEGGDSSGMSRSIPINKIMDDCMIAWAMNGEALRAEQGYPARLVVPGWEGNMWVKWIRRIEFGDMPYMDHVRHVTKFDSADPLHPHIAFPTGNYKTCRLYTSPSPRDATLSRMPSSA